MGRRGSGYLDDDGEFGGAWVGVRSVEAEIQVRFYIRHVALSHLTRRAR